MGDHLTAALSAEVEGSGRLRTHRPGLDFMIVGTPRSGTTLMQRLACELPGVRVPPETHFLRGFIQRVLERRRFPLDREGIVDELERFSRLGTSRGLEVRPEEVADDLGGVCRSPAELFAALVRHLAGPGEIYGEKTPPHLRWWPSVTKAMPQMKLIAVVRDPRAVVASHLKVPWTRGDHVLAAQQWVIDQRNVRAAAQALGPRCLVVRYEDMVADPDAARAAVAALLGVEVAVVPLAGRRLFLSWETWKANATGPVDPTRASGWRSALLATQARQVSAICRREMWRFGYDDALPSWSAAALRRLTLSPRRQYMRLRLRVTRECQRRRIARLDLGQESRS